MCAVSKYFKHVSAKNEQRLIDNLTREVIFQRGLDMVYIPRVASEEGFDYLFGENPENVFETGVLIEMYLLQIRDGFDGDDFIGRFGLKLDDNAVFIVARSRFEDEITKRYPDIVRPREGDLILFKVDPKEQMTLFEIKYIEKEHPFFTIGKSTTYRIEAERFNYSHETMNTGDPAIDDVDMGTYEEYQDNTPIQTESNTIVNFNENDPFSDGEY